MSASAAPILAQGLLSLGDLDRLLERLPARIRADLKWARPDLEAALRRLTDGPLSDEGVQSAVRETFSVLMRLSRALALIPAAVTQVIPAAEVEWERRLRLLRTFIADSGAADATEWALRAVLSVLAQHVSSAEVAQRAPALSEADVDRAFEQDTAALLRAQVLVMALLELAERDGDQGRAIDLAVLAYREACRGVDAVARQGLHIDPFARESPKERGERLERYAESLRQCLTDEDEDTLTGARLKTLR